MTLSRAQQKQLDSQLKQHNHKDYRVDLVLTNEYVLSNFSVHSKVLRPEKMSALYLARWLFFNNGLYKNKVVIDMGSGTGIQGVVCGLYGAKKVIMSDLSSPAVENTRENIKIFKLQRKAKALQGDLFEKIKTKADIIIFNHPFFSDTTIENLLVSSSMLERGKLIHRFFEEAKFYLKKGGLIIMPYFHVAGPINDPSKQAPKHGYKVFERFRVEAKSGLQKGPISVYEISLG
jgi:methylase of polypeptide subunit release factors